MADEKVFSGIRVIDLNCYGVGPMTTRYLADHGAENIKVESSAHVDDIRMSPPFAGGQPGLNRSAYWAEYNQGRLGITINLVRPEGRALFLRLAAVSDIVCENFAGKTAEKWGLAYEDLIKVRPDIIMIRTNMLGHTGPAANHPGHGGVLQAFSGFNHLTGWPDRAAVGTGGPYTDFAAPHLAAASLLAALDYRQRTGKGQYIDSSQLEAGIHFLLPAMLDYSINERIETRAGNRDPYAAPHGAFPCQGEDRWIAIAVETDAEWLALRKVMGEPSWAQDSKFDTLLGRLRHQDKLEQLISQWTADKDAFELMHHLQQAGVPAGVVQHGGDLFDDPQFKHRGHYVPLEHPEIGMQSYEAPSFRLSKTPGRPQRPAPLMGQHNDYVFKELLGLSGREVEDLMEAGIIV